MNHPRTPYQLALICVPFFALTACGGGGGGSGDNANDRLDISDPVVRFVHASPLVANVTLFRDDSPQPFASNVGYKFASNYVQVDNTLNDWSVRTSDNIGVEPSIPIVTIGTVPIDASRGNKYTIVALPSSPSNPAVPGNDPSVNVSTNSLYVIRDPYNKSLTSDKAKLRIMNASFTASSIDLYVNAPGTDIAPAAVAPTIAATNYKTSGPASGNDSYDISGGAYQLTITSAGTKNVLFRGNLVIENNKDVLLLTLPENSVPLRVKTLVKIEGTAGSTEIAPI
jgi:hypothetical protein